MLRAGKDLIIINYAGVNTFFPEKGQLVNIFDFVDHMSVLQLLNSVLTA